MSDSKKEKLLDLRTRHRYLKNGRIAEKDIQSHLKDLPNDEDNFELTTFDDDDLGIGDDLMTSFGEFEESNEDSSSEPESNL